MTRSARSGFALGCIASLLIAAVILSLIVISSAGSYRGKCITLEGPAGECSLLEYLLQALVLVSISSPYTHTFLFFSLLAMLLMFPVLGYMIAERLQRRRAGDAVNQKDQY